MMTSSHHPLRASSGDWWVDIIRISTNEKTLRSSHQYHHCWWYCPKNIQFNILYCHYFFYWQSHVTGCPVTPVTWRKLNDSNRLSIWPIYIPYASPIFSTTKFRHDTLNLALQHFYFSTAISKVINTSYRYTHATWQSALWHSSITTYIAQTT